jgi:hypothetical protein
LAHVVIGRGGDGAGVEHDQIGGSAFVSSAETLACQQRFQGCAIGLSSATPEVLNEELPHLYPG